MAQPTPREYRRKVELFIHDGKGNVLASPTPDGGYRFPGGGIDDGESVSQAARREALEEVAWKVKTPRAVPKHGPELVKWTNAQRDLWGHKGRSHFAGTKTYRRVAEADKLDKSLYGADDDTLKAKFVPIPDVLKAVERTVKMPKGPYTPYHEDKARALGALNQMVGAGAKMNEKTAWYLGQREKTANRLLDWARRTSPLHSGYRRVFEPVDDFMASAAVPDRVTDAYLKARRPLQTAMATDGILSKRLGLYRAPRRGVKTTETEMDLSPEEFADLFGA